LAWKNWQTDTFDKLTKDLTKKSNRATNYFFKLYQLQWQEHQLVDTNSPQDGTDKWKMSATLDNSYYIEKLKHYCLLLSYQQVYSLDHQLPAIDTVLLAILAEKKLDIPIISVYYHCAEMLKNPANNGNFLTFKKLLFLHQNLLPNAEFRGLLLMSINFCIRQINNGQRNYLSQLLEFYQVGLTTNTLLENGSLSRITYHNIVGTGINSDNLPWTKQFIGQYKNLLEKKYREVKTLLLKVYVEQDEDALLFAHLEAMQRYIRRKQVIGYHKKNYLNIIKYTKQMRSLNFFDRAAIEIFKTKVQAEEVLTEKSWFLQQLKKL